MANSLKDKIPPHPTPPWLSEEGKNPSLLNIKYQVWVQNSNEVLTMSLESLYTTMYTDFRPYHTHTSTLKSGLTLSLQSYNSWGIET